MTTIHYRIIYKPAAQDLLSLSFSDKICFCTAGILQKGKGVKWGTPSKNWDTHVYPHDQINC